MHPARDDARHRASGIRRRAPVHRNSRSGSETLLGAAGEITVSLLGCGVVLLAKPRRFGFAKDVPHGSTHPNTVSTTALIPGMSVTRGKDMTSVVIGGTGFIGRRLIPRLVERGEDVVCMDINRDTAAFEAEGDQVEVVRGDVTQFDDVMALVAEVRPERLINLSYYIGSDLPPRVATKLNVVGMDNCFEAARLAGVRHTVFASSLAVSGAQHHFGERATTEDDFRHGAKQYAVCKIFNEWQAKDYIDKYGMTITAVRPANVTGPDKIPRLGRPRELRHPARRAASRSASRIATPCARRSTSTTSPRCSRASP